MSSRLVSIIIVTAGIKNYINSCLDSIKEQTHSTLETLVVDNSFNQNFSQELSECYPDIKLYSSPENLFYCQALNKGIEVSNGNFILCLNDDVILDKRFIEEALKGFSIDEKIGMVSGKILRWDRVTIDSTGLFLSPWRIAKERGYGLKDKGQFKREGYVFGVNGAVAFYRKKMLEQIKISLPHPCVQEGGSEYFDSDFRFFYEDLDIAWRAQNIGWKGYYIPLAVAYHLRGGTARESKGINKNFARFYISDALCRDLIKNRYLAIIKNECLLGFFTHLPFMIAYDLAVWTFTLLLRPQILKTVSEFSPFFWRAFRKRRQGLHPVIICK